MTGAHRQAELSPARSVLESVRWLLALVGLIAAGLAIVGIPVYFAITNSRFLPILVVAMQGLLIVVSARRLAVNVLRNRTPSPVILADWIDDAGIVIALVASVVANVGNREGWLHGAFEFTMLGILGLFVVGMPVFWWRGKGHLIHALTGRAVAGRWPWSARDAEL